MKRRRWLLVLAVLVLATFVGVLLWRRSPRTADLSTMIDTAIFEHLDIAPSGRATSVSLGVIFVRSSKLRILASTGRVADPVRMIDLLQEATSSDREGTLVHFFGKHQIVNEPFSSLRVAAEDSRRQRELAERPILKGGMFEDLGNGRKNFVVVAGKVPTIVPSESTVSTMIGGNSPIMKNGVASTRRLGVGLTIKSRALADGRIRVTVESDVQFEDPWKRSDEICPVTQLRVPVLQKTKQTATHYVLCGEAMVVGVFPYRMSFGGQYRVPLLSDLPLLGDLFVLDGNDDASVFIVVVPTIATRQ